MEETVISEGTRYAEDVPKYLIEYQQASKNYMLQENYQSALETLFLSQDLLEALSSQGIMVDGKFLLATMHNISYCYAK